MHLVTLVSESDQSLADPLNLRLPRFDLVKPTKFARKSPEGDPYYYLMSYVEWKMT